MTGSNINSSPPVIGITMGDPAGIGPEVIVRSLTEASIRRSVLPVVIGDRKVLENTCRTLGSECTFVEYAAETAVRDEAIALIDLAISGEFENGKVSAAAGKASGQYIEKAFELWQSGGIDAICTAPINKESFNFGGYEYPGHTEFFAALAKVEKFAMSFFAGNLRVVLLSTHLPLSDAIQAVKREPVAELIQFADHALSKLLGKKISIAVAGLNPHASENGKFGHEEEKEIAPAIAECRSKGVDVSGPYSPDTVFLRAYNGEFDAVIAHYHDQATIPVKALSFGSAVNVTLGLPFIRTSVDHGTAFDIAGKNVADPSSMIAAIKLAGELSQMRTPGK